MKIERIIFTISISFIFSLSQLLFHIAAAQEKDSTATGKLKNLLDMELTDLLDIKVVSGEKGGFGKQLEELKLKTYLHGYAAGWYRTYDLNRRKRTSTFSLQYFNPILGVNIQDKVVAEIMMEYEHAGSELGIRYGIIDYSPFKFLTLRAGKFLMPMGKFNEYYYPEYINLLNDRPISHWQILPSVWSEVGAQLRGKFSLSKKSSFNYSLFVVNGLEQKNGKYGGDIREMRDNFRDYKNEKKSFGGRIGILPVPEIESGVSYYYGPYTTDGKENLSILCIDVGYNTKKFNLRGEYVSAIQDTLSGSINKNGFFVESAYRVNLYLKPVIRYDQAYLPAVAGFDKIINTKTIQRVTAGLTIYPEPKLVSRFSIKINYSAVLNDGNGSLTNEFILQTAIGF
ncbi:MAG: hypothetical protein HYY40_10850 [Bacteroidetes bacterium]|nr:hypothetical protein [Bacteroidota bacterium]